jgi:ribosomal protein L24
MKQFRIRKDDKVMVIAGKDEGKIGKVTGYLYDTITSIQWGKAEDPFGWTYPID